MSRNGVLSFSPFFTIRIRPARSTTNSRWVSPRGAVTKIGESKLPTFLSFTPRAALRAGLAALVPEPASEPLPQPPQPARTRIEAAIAADAARGGTRQRIAAPAREPIRLPPRTHLDEGTGNRSDRVRGRPAGRGARRRRHRGPLHGARLEER